VLLDPFLIALLRAVACASHQLQLLLVDQAKWRRLRSRTVTQESRRISPPCGVDRVQRVRTVPTVPRSLARSCPRALHPSALRGSVKPCKVDGEDVIEIHGVLSPAPEKQEPGLGGSARRCARLFLPEIAALARFSYRPNKLPQNSCSNLPLRTRCRPVRRARFRGHASSHLSAVRAADERDKCSTA
jgi:hypothetical protein